MNGKSWSIPAGMVFKKYYCSKCGEKLVKEKTHRVVTKEDKDYYQYHDYNMYPRNPVDVYSYRFRCNHCNKSISYSEQCILEKIQKKYKTKVLIDEEIKEYYNESKKIVEKNSLIQEIIVVISFIILGTILMILTSENEKTTFAMIIFMAIFSIFLIINIFRSHKGKRKLRMHQEYSYDYENLMEKLHTYCSNNKDLIIKSNKCYCFHCCKAFSKEEIKEYIDENNDTALCPYCDIDSILPDTIAEELNDKLIDEMNKYWF